MVTTRRRISRELTTTLKKRENETSIFRRDAIERFLRDPGYRSVVFDVIDESARRHSNLGRILTEAIAERILNDAA